MAFDPSRIPEDASGTGQLDVDPLHAVLSALHRHQATGRLTLTEAVGENHMYLMQGQPVGVQLAERIHPLGQLLLELGLVDGRGFLAAQRLIRAQLRMPAQVFKELGYLDEEGLRQVLGLQARRKAEYFCGCAARSFTFSRGLSHLAGFTATPLHIDAVIFLAVRQGLAPEARHLVMQRLRQHEVRLEAASGSPLPAPLELYGFGPPEERFLQRLASDWQRVSDLEETGTLPADEVAVLLHHLERGGRLELRSPPALTPPDALTAPTDDEVFASTKPPTARVAPASPSRSPARSPSRPQAPAARAETPAPTVKKKKVRRATPEPSVGSSAVSELRREKTQVTPLPSIVVSDE